MSFAMIDNLDHAIQTWAVGLGIPGEYFLRLVLAVMLGGLVGLDRQVRGRAAGLRTNVLVCLGSALVMIVSLHFSIHPWTAQGPGININIDPARIAYGVMTGVGFLGAGAIVHGSGSVRGLTTAAGMWCVAATGLAVGFGLYLIAMATTLLILVVLMLLDNFEDYLPRSHYRTVKIRRAWDSDCIEATVRRFEADGLRVIGSDFDRSVDLKYAVIQLQIAYTDERRFIHLQRHLEDDGQYQLMAVSDFASV